MHDHRDCREMRDGHSYDSSHEDFLEQLRSLMKEDTKEPDLDTDELEKLFDELFDEDD